MGMDGSWIMMAVDFGSLDWEDDTRFGYLKETYLFKDNRVTQWTMSFSKKTMLPSSYKLLYPKYKHPTMKSSMMFLWSSLHHMRRVVLTMKGEDS